MTPALVLSKNIFYRNRESEHIFNLEDCVRIIISWSEWGDSNSRHLEPKQSNKLFSNLFESVYRFLLRKIALSGTLCPIVSECSNSVYGQKCGQIQTLPER